MLHYLSESDDTYFNLATEEYFLKNFSENIFMLWRSEPSVVVGKHQNCMAEINYRYVRENNIQVARRLSGGGTVVHDMQNLNFTFIANGEDGKLIDFKRFVMPIIEFLETLGINAQIGEKNDIRIGDLKISGNAEHIYRKRVLHHGTLLFNSDLKRLSEAIKVKGNVYFDKAVQSNRTTVTNIIDHLQNNLTIEEFITGMSTFLYSKKDDIKDYKLTGEDRSIIEALVSQKYQTEDWIYGYSPKYRLEKSFTINNGIWKVELKVEKGVIVSAIILLNNEKHPISNSIVGLKHRFGEIKAELENTLGAERKDLDKMAEEFF